MTDAAQTILRRMEPSDGATLQRDPYAGVWAGSHVEPKPTHGPGDEPDPQEVRQAVDRLNDAVKTLELGARFRVLDEPRQVIVEMYDTSTGEVIRQIPPRSFLQMYADMMHLIGLSLDRKA